MAASVEPEIVSCAEHDYLEQDPAIRGQRFACVSFVSPEEVLAKKDAYIASRFVEHLGRDVNEMFENLDAKFGAQDPEARQTIYMLRERYAYLASDKAMQDEFHAFRTMREGELDDAFRQQQGFQTSIRGFKIRGVYETVDDASARAKAIRKFDDKFHVYIAEVGCWCPWSPNPDDIKNTEYSETQLNTLVKKYNEVQELRAEIYEQRKSEMMKRIEEDKDAWLQKKKQELAAMKEEEEPSEQPSEQPSEAAEGGDGAATAATQEEARPSEESESAH